MKRGSGDSNKTAVTYLGEILAKRRCVLQYEEVMNRFKADFEMKLSCQKLELDVIETRAVGSSKKEAKQNAAKAMLLKLRSINDHDLQDDVDNVIEILGLDEIGDITVRRLTRLCIRNDLQEPQFVQNTMPKSTEPKKRCIVKCTAGKFTSEQKAPTIKDALKLAVTQVYNEMMQAVDWGESLV